MVLGLVSTAVFAAIGPQQLVEQTSQTMLAKLKQEKQLLEAEPGRIYGLVDEIVVPHFDFEYMSQMVLAKYWRAASAEQRQAFTAEFRQLLVRTYATSLKEYSDQELIYLPFREGSNKDQATVRTEVEQAGGFPIPIDYRLRLNSSDWKVFDVIIDGVSLVTNYRSTFAKEIRDGGLDGLIETLVKRNHEVQGQ
jgi:phospholipid transport system substrate-binding protein